jgi:ABC-type proline/glycine betaine transport system permease subunit
VSAGYKPRMRPSVQRGAVIAAVVLLAVGLDAATGFNVMGAAGCLGYILVQLVAMTAGILVAAGGLMVWVFSRFRSDKALYVGLGAIAFIVPALVLQNVLRLIGLACIG